MQIREHIIQTLMPGSRQTSSLVEEVSALTKVTPQGVYKTLRQLRKEEVVLIAKRRVSLSPVWLFERREAFDFAIRAQRGQSLVQEIHEEEKQRVHFRFNTLNELDSFWVYAHTQLAEDIPIHEASYSIQPHDWYYYMREGSDIYWIQKHKEAGRISRTVLTQSTELDRSVLLSRKIELGKLIEYTIGENPLKQDMYTYYTIVKPYIFTAIFDTKVAETLSAFIESQKKLPLSEAEQTRAEAIVRMKGIFKFTIERSSEKSDRLIQRVRKYFEF